MVNMKWFVICSQIWSGMYKLTPCQVSMSLSIKLSVLDVVVMNELLREQMFCFSCVKFTGGWRNTVSMASTSTQSCPCFTLTMALHLSPTALMSESWACALILTQHLSTVNFLTLDARFASLLLDQSFVCDCSRIIASSSFSNRWDLE
jgi:hypothetical protein